MQSANHKYGIHFSRTAVINELMEDIHTCTLGPMIGETVMQWIHQLHVQNKLLEKERFECKWQSMEDKHPQTQTKEKF